MDNKDDVLDLYTAVSECLNRYVSNTAYVCYNNDASIKQGKYTKPMEQRVIINRYFINLLFAYRAKVNKPINNTLFMLTNEGNNNDWYNLFLKYVIPFLKDNDVFNIVYGKIDNLELEY